jgi:hypothetical protein
MGLRMKQIFIADPLLAMRCRGALHTVLVDGAVLVCFRRML